MIDDLKNAAPRIEELERRLEAQRVQLERALAYQEELTVRVLTALVHALEAKNVSLSGHSSRVSAYAATIAAELGVSDVEVDFVRAAGRLHDLGMIGIREEVLDKHGRLTDEEYEHVKEHVMIGARILEPLEQLGPVIDYVRSHHERWDGSGYPDGMMGTDIPLGARIIHVAEVYDALTSKRPYQDAFSESNAVARLRELSGKILDADPVEALARAIDGGRTIAFVPLDAPPMEDTT